MAQRLEPCQARDSLPITLGRGGMEHASCHEGLMEVGEGSTTRAGRSS